MATLHATFDVSSWDEVAFDERGGATKLTEATVTRGYSGDIEGSSVTKWLMAYAPDGTATFVGIERLVGSIGGRKGSLVLRHVGQFSDGAATATLTIVVGAGELEPVTGAGSFRADPGGSVTLDLDGD